MVRGMGKVSKCILMEIIMMDGGKMTNDVEMGNIFTQTEISTKDCGMMMKDLMAKVYIHLLMDKNIMENFKMVKSLEWMCDYCVEEEELPNFKQTCTICKVISDTPEILKSVK